MHVLVMGGSQFNGRALVHELIYRGHRVSVFNRGVTPVRWPAGVEALQGDRTDADSVRQALEGCSFDAICDLSAYRPEDVALMVELFRGRVGHYLFASSTVIYETTGLLPITEDHPVRRGREQSDYAMGKILAEDVLTQAWREQRFPATTVVLSMVFGPHNIIADREQRMFARLHQGRPVLIPGDGTTLGQIGHVEDSARAFCDLLLQPVSFGKRYNAVSDDFYSDEGYVDTFAAVTGATPEKVFIPHALMDDLWDGRIDLDIPDIQARIETRTSAADRRMMALFNLTKLIQRSGFHVHRWNRSVIYSSQALNRDVGWRPRYSFAGAVQQTWDWYVDSGELARSNFDFGFEDELIRRLRSLS